MEGGGSDRDAWRNGKDQHAMFLIVCMSHNDHVTHLHSLL